MKIYIDLSVLSSSGLAIGRVSGVLEFAAVPPVGSSVMLTRPTNDVPLIAVGGFSGSLKVADLWFEPASVDINIALSLEDVVVASVEDGRRVMSFLENGFGLSSEEYDYDE